jgi:hypothetical protein
MTTSTKLFIGLAIVGSTLSLMAFNNKTSNQEKKEVMQVNVLESVVSGGVGRSRMIVTKSNGEQEVTDLENYYSMVGVNFGNIQSNDRKVVEKLNALEKEGWHIVAQSAGGNNIYATKIILERIAP